MSVASIQSCGMSSAGITIRVAGLTSGFSCAGADCISSFRAGKRLPLVFLCQDKICPTVCSLGVLIVASFCGELFISCLHIVVCPDTIILLVVLAFTKCYGLLRP